MATDDQQVLVTGQEATPAHWTVPGNGQIQPKTVYAVYDGSGAGTAFTPALKIYSDGGELIGIYATGSSVAAGGSAAVTWFPDGELDTGAGSAGSVASIQSADPSIQVGYADPTSPTVATGTLDVIASTHPPVTDWSNASHKITSVTDPTAAQDAATKNYVDTAISGGTTPTGSAGGDLSGTYPNPTVAAVHETSGPTKLTLGAIADGEFLKRSAGTIIGTAAGAGTISDITSTGGTITVGAPTGPTTNVDLPTTGVSAASYGDASHVGSFTVDAEGRLTAASSVAISGLAGSGLVLLYDSGPIGSAQASIDTGANGVAAGHGDLIIYAVARSAGATATDTVALRLNNDSGNNYVRQVVQVSNTTVTGVTGATSGVSMQVNGNSGIANGAGAGSFTIPMYDQTTYTKMVIYQAGNNDSGTAANRTFQQGQTEWHNTAAVSRVSIACTSGQNIMAGGRLVVYGTK